MTINYFECEPIVVDAVIYKYKQEVLTVYLNGQAKPIQIKLPEIDAFVFYLWSTALEPCTFRKIMQLCGAKSVLINHFATVEVRANLKQRMVQQYKLAHLHNEGLVLFDKFRTNKQIGEEYVEGEPREFNYSMNGGRAQFQLLLDDGYFLPYIIQAVKHKLISI